ncbi:MAG: molybdenum cofactor guanylyltransferase MobA [Pseudomonadota bacterium]
MKSSELIVGIILAGGLARRMGGGDKCLLPLGGKTLLQRTIERAQPQVSQLLLNANGSSLRFARTRLPVLADQFPNNLGPLAGVHAGLSWMIAKATNQEWLMSFASDTPFFPLDVVSKLAVHTVTSPLKSGNAPLIIASSNLQIHPVFSLWHISLLPKLTSQLQTGEIPRLQEWVKQHKPQYVDFVVKDYDPFFNINSPQDLYTAEPLVSLVK